MGDEATEIVFAEGIIGVPRARRFLMLEQPGSALRVLQCRDIDGFDLPVADPLLADPGYAPRLGPRVARALELEPDDPVLLLAIATREPEGPVLNLRAPLVINVRRRQAAQVILDDRALPLRAPLAARTAAGEPGG